MRYTIIPTKIWRGSLGWFGNKDKEKKSMAVPPVGVPRKEPTMANKKEKEFTKAPGTGELNALLGKGSEFEGKLVFEGTETLYGLPSARFLPYEIQ